MTRGDVVLIADRQAGDYAGKPRPAVILQDDRFLATGSLTVALMAGQTTEAPIMRIRIKPSATLPLKQVSYVMTGRVTTVRQDRVRPPIGRLSRKDMLRLDRSLMVFLGLG